MKRMINIGGKRYVLRYTLSRIALIEDAVGMPTVAELRKFNNLLRLSSLKTYIAFGLKGAGEESFVSTDDGMELAEQYIYSVGYYKANEVVLKAIQKDCPFFLPSRLVEFEYLGGEPDPDYLEIAEPYKEELEFAFFAANFGYSKQDYEALTPLERAVVRKAWEDKIVSDSYAIYNAVYTATYNVNRKKGKKALKLWKKSQRAKKVDEEKMQNDLAIALEIEKKEGKGWVDKIYKAAGLKRRKDVGYGRSNYLGSQPESK